MKTQLFLVLVAVCILAHLVRLVYEVLKHRKRIVPGRVSFVIVFTDMILLWASWFMLCRQDNFRVDVPVIVPWLGIVLSVTGIILFLTALFTIKSLETYEGDLVTHGIYSRIRHPMYLGFLCWLVGFPTIFGAGFAFLLSIPLIANVLYWRYLEEEELVMRFPAYATYRKQTLF
jgi:protein-S-isoprenylcysteine O-methyltransferase Ste14